MARFQTLLDYFINFCSVSEAEYTFHVSLHMHCWTWNK